MENALSFVITGFCFLALAFGLAIVPLFQALKIVRAEQGRARVFWLGGVMVLWPFVNYAYGFFRGTQRERVIGVVAIMLMLVSGVGVAWLVRGAMNLASQQLTVLGETAPRYLFPEDFAGAPGGVERARDELALSLRFLKAELDQSPWYDLEKKLGIINLIQILMEMGLNERITLKEFEYWRSQAQSVNHLHRAAFLEYRRVQDALEAPSP